ncbi:MAG: SDR family NAD(P)-dependent oxidoreductase [Marinilabiliaceae bacterium]|nr:SDR family NAD(P)-dependent oxidoreductase [Marinilabiliaceae bacterium]
MTKIALITGATSGIGRATAKKMFSSGYKVIITGRRKELLDSLISEISTGNDLVIPLNFDIRNHDECKKAFESLPDDWKKIDVLINNAGLAAGADPIDKGNRDDWERMIDTNIKGLLYITQIVIPGMMERKNGHIVNIGSIAGHEVYANGNVYCASKFAVNAITKGMRIDLLPYNIKVSAVSPGMVETEFSLVRYHGDKQKADNVYKGITPLNAEDVAEAIEFLVTRPKHVNVNDIILVPTAQASAVYNFRE